MQRLAGKRCNPLETIEAWTLLTTMFEIKGHEEPNGVRRPKGAEHGANPNRQTWLERQHAEAEQLGYTTQPYTVIIGGGQGGIALGARLRQLGVPTIIIDRNPRPGDAAVPDHARVPDPGV